MDAKFIPIGIGVVAVVAVGGFMYSKSLPSSESVPTANGVQSIDSVSVGDSSVDSSVDAVSSQTFPAGNSGSSEAKGDRDSRGEAESGDEAGESEDVGDDEGSERGSAITQPATSPAPAPTTSPASKPATQYKLADVAKHSSASSCWSAINGSVYDLTKWIPQHPGGERAILSICGRDGSAAFNGQHGGMQRQAQILATFKIGTLMQ